MIAILQSMNAYTGVFTVALTAVMVMLTYLYVRYTKLILEANHKTLEEVKEQAWLASRAYLVFRLVFKHQCICAFELANEGRSPARSVRLSLDRGIFQGGNREKRINDLPMFSRGLEVVPPGVRSSVLLWSGTVKPGTELYPDKFKITARYETLGRNVQEETTLDVYIYSEFPPYSIEESLQKMARTLDEIKKTSEKLSFRMQLGQGTGA